MAEHTRVTCKIICTPPEVSNIKKLFFFNLRTQNDLFYIHYSNTDMISIKDFKTLRLILLLIQYMITLVSID